MGWEEHDARERALARAHRALIATGDLVPSKLRGPEARLWADCDLASLAENRLSRIVDPRSLEAGVRERLAEAVGQRLPGPGERRSVRCYWIERDGVRVGTFALSRSCLGIFAYAYSVYLLPPYRGGGIMSGTLRSVHGELERRGLGLRIETGWTWRRAVPFYLRTGFWLHLWKQDLEFVRRPNVPPPVIVVDERDARVSVASRDGPVVLARARRTADRLVDHGEAPGLSEDLGHLSWDARTTLSLAIALRGWPLIRSEAHWQTNRFSDAVHPEALAMRIGIWEEEAAARGWRSGTAVS